METTAAIHRERNSSCRGDTPRGRDGTTLRCQAPASITSSALGTRFPPRSVGLAMRISEYNRQVACNDWVWARQAEHRHPWHKPLPTAIDAGVSSGMPNEKSVSTEDGSEATCEAGQKTGWRLRSVAGPKVRYGLTAAGLWKARSALHPGVDSKWHDANGKFRV